MVRFVIQRIKNFTPPKVPSTEPAWTGRRLRGSRCYQSRNTLAHQMEPLLAINASNALEFEMSGVIQPTRSKPLSKTPVPFLIQGTAMELIFKPDMMAGKQKNCLGSPMSLKTSSEVQTTATTFSAGQPRTPTDHGAGHAKTLTRNFIVRLCGFAFVLV
jgi:hypothetical protein